MRVTVVLADGKKVRRIVKSPPFQMLTARGVDMVLEQEANRVGRFFPGKEFRLVPLRDGKSFNFVEIAPVPQECLGYEVVGIS